MKSCIPDNMPLEDDDPVSVEVGHVPVVPVVAPTVEVGPVVPADEVDQAAQACGEVRPVDIVAYPDEHNEVVTTDDSDLRPGNTPAPILRRSRRIGRLTQAYCNRFTPV